MKTQGKKIVASIAVVGTVAALALFNVSTTGDAETHGNFLAATQPDQQVVSAFGEFI